MVALSKKSPCILADNKGTWPTRAGRLDTFTRHRASYIIANYYKLLFNFIQLIGKLQRLWVLLEGNELKELTYCRDYNIYRLCEIISLHYRPTTIL